jgi:hypothetical protein
MYRSKVIILILLVFTDLVSFSQNDSISNPQIDKVVSMVNTVEANNNFLDQLTPDSNVVLPFGIIKKIGEVRYIVAIDSVKFKPAGAYFSAYAAIDFPGSNKKLAFEATNIKFNPKGVVGGNQAKLMLVSEHSIKINNTVTLKLKPDGQNFVEWDCNGFKGISLKGYFVFSQGKLKPDKTETQDSTVTASFQIYTNDIHNFVAQVNITPFNIEGLNNWSFKVTNATVDMSELVNAPQMAFPSGYSNPNMVTPQMWTGFYLQDLKIKLPTEISKTGKRTEIEVKNLLIDHMGVTGLFQVNNIFSTQEGSMSGWAFSLDELGVGFVCNHLNSGHLKGKVNIPAMSNEQTLAFTANVYENPQNKEVDYNFTISPATGLKFDVFTAEVDLFNTSNITIAKSNGLFKPSALLNGKISFTGEKMNSGGGYLLFQNLSIITNAPYITNGVFTLHTNGSQTKVAKYPVSINDITFGIDQGAPIFGFSVSLNFSESEGSGLSVGTLVQIKGKIETSQQTYSGDAPVTLTKTNWKFDRVAINGISIDVKTSVFVLGGLIIFRDNDPVYGDGFFGRIQFAIKDVLPDPAVVTVCFGAKDAYRYFYYDAAIPVQIPLGNIPITLTKLMGGVYYHMKPSVTTEEQLIMASKNQPVTATNALSYVPDPLMGLGFKAGVGFIYSPSETTINGDVMLEVLFTSSGGLSFISLTGDVYCMAKVSERAKAPVTGHIIIKYDNENKTFDANAIIDINAYSVVTGHGLTKFHIEPGIWYLSVGKPSSPTTISILGKVNATSYFMVGNAIELAPSPPPEILNIINQGASLPPRDNSSLSTGSGFCTGAALRSDFDKQIGYNDFSIHAAYSFGLGFDMMMINYGKNGYCSNNNEKIGLNGWLAEGSMYLWMSGSLGIKGTVKVPAICYTETDGPPYPCGTVLKPDVCHDKIRIPYPCLEDQTFDKPIFTAAVAALVQGKMPKPIYFRGDFVCTYDVFGILHGNYQFNYEYGDDCTPVKSL